MKGEDECNKKKMIDGNFRYCNCWCDVCKDFVCNKCYSKLDYDINTGEPQ